MSEGKSLKSWYTPTLPSQTRPFIKAIELAIRQQEDTLSSLQILLNHAVTLHRDVKSTMVPYCTAVVRYDTRTEQRDMLRLQVEELLANHDKVIASQQRAQEVARKYHAKYETIAARNEELRRKLEERSRGTVSDLRTATRFETPETVETRTVTKSVTAGARAEMDVENEVVDIITDVMSRALDDEHIYLSPVYTETCVRHLQEEKEGAVSDDTSVSSETSAMEEEDIEGKTKAQDVLDSPCNVN